MVPVKRILVPTDFSETSDAALKYGIGLAQAFSAQLYLLHVPKTGVNFEADFPMVQFETAPQERLETLVGEQEARQLRPEYALRIGAPSDEIVRYAGYREIDLIVMGTHGRSGMPHMLMGSVAEKVLRTAPCPVLTVRPPRGAAAKPEADAATAQTAPERPEALAAGGSRALHRVSRLRGTDVEGIDGYIGRVEGFYFDDAEWTIRYIVVNAGSWLTRHPVLISPEAVKRNWGLAGFNVALTRNQVRNSPEIDPQRVLLRQDEERVLGHFGHSLYLESQWPERLDAQFVQHERGRRRSHSGQRRRDRARRRLPDRRSELARRLSGRRHEQLDRRQVGADRADDPRRHRLAEFETVGRTYP